MKHNGLLTKLVILTSLLGLLLAACSPQSSPPSSSGSQPVETPPPAPVKLKMAVLPILEALPMYVAEQKGYFEQHGVEIEFIPVQSAAERDQIMAAGQADGMINDLISTLLYNKDQTQIVIVRFARTATREFPQYRILAAANSGITSVGDLAGVEIGVSEASVIAYTTDRLLQAEGLSKDEIKTIAVPKIPDRMALLASGELKAANMPDPFSLLAMQSGAVLITDDSKHPEYGNSVYSFRKTVIDANPEAIKGFLAAIEQAIHDVNAAKDEFSGLLSEKQLIPAPIAGSYQIPTLPSASVPSEAQWEDVVAWAKEKNLTLADVSYTESVSSEYLP